MSRTPLSEFGHLASSALATRPYANDHVALPRQSNEAIPYATSVLPPFERGSNEQACPLALRGCGSIPEC